MKKSKTKLKKSTNGKALQLERQYLRVFGYNGFPSRKAADIYFQEPSLLKWVPSETTYGIGTV